MGSTIQGTLSVSVKVRTLQAEEVHHRKFPGCRRRSLGRKSITGSSEAEERSFKERSPSQEVPRLQEGVLRKEVHYRKFQGCKKES